MSINSSNSSQDRCNGLYQFYWALRARGLPKLELEGLSCDATILRIEEWLNSKDTNFSQFKVLAMCCQGLTFIPEQIARFENLTWLNLSGNNLKDLPDSIGKLKKLKFLDISENKFSECPKALTQLVSLKELYQDKDKT